MATFEECNRLRREGNEALYDYGDVSSISVTQLDTSYVLLVVYKGRYKKRPPENFYIGAVKVIAVKEGEEDVVQADGPKNLQHEDPALQYLDEPTTPDTPIPVPAEDKDKKK